MSTLEDIHLILRNIDARLARVEHSNKTHDSVIRKLTDVVKELIAGESGNEGQPDHA